MFGKLFVGKFVGKSTSGVPIRFRRMRFDLGEEVPRYWFRGSPFLTHYFNALSAAFPPGERFFIESVREFEHVADSDPVLKEQIREFSRQEGHHSHQHKLLNDLLTRHGLPVAECQKAVEERVRVFKHKYSPLTRLAMTCGFEHFTALMSDWVLQQPERIDAMHPKVGPLWFWHAVEETEHKAVAFDVYTAAGGTYARRALSMLVATLEFIPRTHQMQWGLMRADPEAFDVVDVVQGLWFLYGKGGLMSSLTPEYLRYFRPDFHPWQHDNSALIAKWVETFADEQAAA